MTQVNRDIEKWRDNGGHLPEELRDFHDQKDLFRLMHRAFGDPKPDALVREPNVVEGHCYVIDKFLWFMARYGYTLQRTRSKLPFDSLSEDIANMRRERAESLARMFKKDAGDGQTDEKSVIPTSLPHERRKKIPFQRPTPVKRSELVSGSPIPLTRDELVDLLAILEEAHKVIQRAPTASITDALKEGERIVSTRRLARFNNLPPEEFLKRRSEYAEMSLWFCRSVEYLHKWMCKQVGSNPEEPLSYESWLVKNNPELKSALESSPERVRAKKINRGRIKWVGDMISQLEQEINRTTE